MITIKIYTYGGLRRYTHHKRKITIEIDSPKTINAIMKVANVPSSHVYIIEKDGQAVGREMKVDDDCELKLVPYLTGG